MSTAEVLPPRAGRAAAQTSGAPPAQVTAHTDIARIDAGLWDSVVPAHELQLRHAFVRACQDARVEGVEYRHLLVWRDGALAGVASLMRMDVRLELLCPFAFRGAIRAVRRAMPGFMRPTLLLCGLPVSAGRPAIACRDEADAGLVYGAVAAFMDTLAPRLGATLLCFKEFDAETAAGADALLRLGYFRAHSLPSFRMQLRWRSYAEWLAAMRAGYRRQAISTQRGSDDAGLVARVVRPGAAACRRFFRLYEQVLDRAQYQLERLNADFFERLAAYLPQHVRLVLLERGAAPVAAAMMLETPGRSTFFMAGLDYGFDGRHAAYHRLLAEVVRAAVEAGATSLELGQTSAEAKQRIGAVPEPRYLYFRHRSRWAHHLFRATAPLLFPPPRLRPRRVFRRGGV